LRGDRQALGLKGNWLTIFSRFLGIAFGVADKIAESGVPSGFARWFVMINFGLVLGLITSGFYDFANQHMPN
jgi:hypothetical protein